MAAALGINGARLGIVLVVVLAPALRAAEPAPPTAKTPPLDPLAQAVVDSLAYPPQTSPRQLLDAVLKTNDVEAFDASLGYFKQLVQTIADAGDGRAGLLADLGDRVDQGALRRLERTLGARDPEVLPVVQAILEAAALRRRDPQELARAIEDLRSDSYKTRLAATDRLGRTGIDALPALIDLLQSSDPAGKRAREIARGLVRDCGDDGRRVLVAWLGSPDIAHWPGVIAALDASAAENVAEFFLAPALAEGTPPAVRTAALAALAHHAARCAPDEDPALWQPPTRGEAIARLTKRLDAVLSPPPSSQTGGGHHGIAKHDSAMYHEAGNLAARDREATHLARDLEALGVTEPPAVRLVLLAQLQATLAQPERLTPEQLLEALRGPDGIDVEAIADVLDTAVIRGMFPAAAAAAEALEYATASGGKPATKESLALPPVARRALVRALAIPDFTLQFQAARTLALVGSDPPYPGASHVIDVLDHATTSTGVDRVVVAHHDPAIAEELATDVSRFGYQTVRVSTGRDAVAAAREHRDTVLVILDARIIHPSAYETAQFIQQQAFGDIPPILVVVDPLDDDPRGRFLTRLITKFSGLECVALIDRLDSFFEPVLNPETKEVVAPARFPEALAHLVGTDAVDPKARAARAALRLEQSREAAALLATLACRGWEVPVSTLVKLESGADALHGQYNLPRDSSPRSIPAAPPVDAALSQPTR